MKSEVGSIEPELTKYQENNVVSEACQALNKRDVAIASAHFRELRSQNSGAYMKDRHLDRESEQVVHKGSQNLVDKGFRVHACCRLQLVVDDELL